MRFSQVVEQSGKPEVYLLLVDPKKDPDFQKALKADRVMTIQRGKTDYGTVGYTAGAQIQVLLFPRALKIPVDAHVVGIRYDLLKDHPAQKHSRPEPKARPAKVTKPEPKAKMVAVRSKPKPVLKVATFAPVKPKSPAQTKVVSFPEPEPDENDDLDEMKAGVLKALKALETGNQVAAYNILKRLVE